VSVSWEARLAGIEALAGVSAILMPKLPFNFVSERVSVLSGCCEAGLFGECKLLFRAACVNIDFFAWGGHFCL
jgi:hypothetical protein